MFTSDKAKGEAKNNYARGWGRNRSEDPEVFLEVVVLTLRLEKVFVERLEPGGEEGRDFRQRNSRSNTVLQKLKAGCARREGRPGSIPAGPAQSCSGIWTSE